MYQTYDYYSAEHGYGYYQQDANQREFLNDFAL